MFLEVNQVIVFVQSVYVFKGLVGSVRGSARQEGTSVIQFITLCHLKCVVMTCVPFTVATAALCTKSSFPMSICGHMWLARGGTLGVSFLGTLIKAATRDPCLKKVVRAEHGGPHL